MTQREIGALLSRDRTSINNSIFRAEMRLNSWQYEREYRQVSPLILKFDHENTDIIEDGESYAWDFVRI